MKSVFKVTGLGLQVDKVMIMPGSELVLSAPAPSHWQRFGDAGSAEDKKMTVATPKAGNDGKTKKRVGLEDQAGKLGVDFTDDTSDADLIEAIKAKKADSK